jgi:hypothetical protein
VGAEIVQHLKNRTFRRLCYFPVLFGLTCAAAPLNSRTVNAQSSPPAITVSSIVPTELNPPFVPGPNGSGVASGGAPNASPEQASAFAWEEFIALNWPAGPQTGQQGQRGTASTQYRFGDPSYSGPTVWQTFRGKVEIFPGQGNPPGYPGVGNNDASFGYDALPQYNYNPMSATVSACDPRQANDAVPWINLDEIDQISLDYMYAGVVNPVSSPGNNQPQLIRFMAKASRLEYAYVAQNKWWKVVPASIIKNTRDYLATKQYSPPAGSSQYVSLPDGTIEIKAAWRPLNPSELSSGRFQTQTVRFYERTGSITYCYRDATWGLIALHIIQKTPSAPYFIYASFEQADNILTQDGKPVEDTDGNVLTPAPQTATTPQVCLVDPKPQPPTLRPPVPDKPSSMGQVVFTDDPQTCVPAPKTGCTPGSRLYYRNEPGSAPADMNICVNRRDNDIPKYATDATHAAHAAISAYLKQNKIASAPWLYYKLVNVQYYPYDKIITTVTPNGSLYDSRPPYTAKNPARSNFYMANIVVETNRALQLFSGGLSPSISTDWNEDDTEHKNTYYGGNFYNAGGCLGCHGSQGQIPGRPMSPAEPSQMLMAGDFSVILARGHVDFPEGTTKNMDADIPKNRSLR